MLAPSASLADPVADSPTLAAVRWIQDVLCGEVASVVAILAVAGVGALMLAGRIDLRRGAAVVLGCFVLFGAPIIAAGLRVAMDSAGGGQPLPMIAAAPAPATPPKSPGAPPDYDPYSGASVFIGPH